MRAFSTIRLVKFVVSCTRVISFLCCLGCNWRAWAHIEWAANPYCRVPRWSVAHEDDGRRQCCQYYSGAQCRLWSLQWNNWGLRWWWARPVVCDQHELSWSQPLEIEDKGGTHRSGELNVTNSSKLVVSGYLLLNFLMHGAETFIIYIFWHSVFAWLMNRATVRCGLVSPMLWKFRCHALDVSMWICRVVFHCVYIKLCFFGKFKCYFWKFKHLT